jgi:hypothetical protein
MWQAEQLRELCSVGADSSIHFVKQMSLLSVRNALCVCVCVCVTRLPPDYIFIDKNPAAIFLVTLDPFLPLVVAS